MPRLSPRVIQEILETDTEIEDANSLRSCNATNSLERRNLKDHSCNRRRSLKSENQTQRTPSWIENVREYFSEYCAASGVHGVRYLGEGGRFLVEKLTWSVVVVVMCYFCITLILSAYNKWIMSPVIITSATAERPIWEIPFPAVTICPIIKSDTAIFNYTDVFLKLLHSRNVTADELRYYESFSLVCEANNMDEDAAYNLFKKQWLTINESAINDLNTALPETTHQLSWLGTSENISLSTIYTRGGICYSFNMLDINEILFDNVEYVGNGSVKSRKAQEWSIENGYSNRVKTGAFPRRTSLSGIKGGFQILTSINNTHLDYLCADSVQGFKVALHHPSEFPDMNQQFQVPLDKSVLVAIKPRMITVSEELQLYKPKDRGCFFFNERSLMMFRIYSQRNCLDECLANYTLMECGCVAFYMPKLRGTPICGRGSRKCLKMSSVKYLLSETETKTTRKHKLVDCNCLPSCTSLVYDAEISQCDWNWSKRYDVIATFVKDKEFFNEKKAQMTFSKLSVYFRGMQFLPSERHEQYGSVDFFSNAGGLLGLFIGFSVTSAIEIVYFLTLRVVCNMRKYGRALWAGV